MAQTIDVGTRPYSEVAERAGPAFQAFRLLQFVFVVAPIAAGADKFFHLLVNWDQYLAPFVPTLTGIPAHTFMLGVGVIEIIAGILVAVKPRIGSAVVAVWLAGIIVNLLLIPGYFDIALRDLGLCLSAIALFRLSSIYSR
jgi:uncharacterized membrane protein YphA (DoxX/SURF4 family)